MKLTTSKTILTIICSLWFQSLAFAAAAEEDILEPDHNTFYIICTFRDDITQLIWTKTLNRVIEGEFRERTQQNTHLVLQPFQIGGANFLGVCTEIEDFVNQVGRDNILAVITQATSTVLGRFDLAEFYIERLNFLDRSTILSLRGNDNREGSNHRIDFESEHIEAKLCIKTVGRYGPSDFLNDIIQRYLAKRED